MHASEGAGGLRPTKFEEMEGDMVRQNRDIYFRNRVESKKGSTLVIVVCVSAFLMAFALAMLYTSGLLLSRANRRLEQERSYQLAQSFAKVLEQELKADYDKPENAPENSFYRYVYNFLEGRYGEYDPDHPDETIFHYTAALPDGVDTEKYGTIKVVMYKEANQDQDAEMSGELVKDQSVDDVLNNGIARYTFTVEVTAEVGGVSYSYSTVYQQMATYEVSFKHDGKNILWDGSWHEYLSSPEYIVDWEKGNIQYEYQSDKITHCEFANAHE